MIDEVTSNLYVSTDAHTIRQCVPEDFPAVIRLSDQNKRTLGLLPREAIRKYVTDGNVYAAFHKGNLIAYILFSLPRTQIRITHLCVSKEWAHRGIARELVDYLQKIHPTRSGIILHCRRDWPTNGLWERLGFSPLIPKTGRGQTLAELTVWWRDFGNPDLLTLAAETDNSVFAVLDNNVIRDLALKRTQSRRSYPLLEPEVRAKFQWCRTPGISNEINETIDDEVSRGNALRYLTNHTILVTPDAMITAEISEEIFSKISSEKFSNDSSLRADIELISEACAAGCELFITNDEKLQNIVDEIARPLGIRVLLPYQAKLFVHDELDGSDYAPSYLQKSPVSLRPVQPGETIPFRRFLTTSSGEKLPQFRRIFHDLSSSCTSQINELQLIEQNGQATALRHIQFSEAGTLVVPLLRVASSDLENPLSRQLLFDLQQRALDGNRTRIVISDSHLGPSPHLVQWLQKDGWHKNDSGWVKDVSRKTHVLTTDRSERDVHILEHNTWPEKYFGSTIENIVVTIQSSFASQLLGHDNHLPFTDPLLAMSRDKVYFRSKRISRIRSGRARILWYVSGNNGQKFVGTSQVLRQRSGDTDSIFKLLGKLGTLSLEQLKGLTKDDDITAIVFRNTEIFDYPISLDSMRKWLREDGKAIPPFLAPVAISEDLYARVYRYGFGIK